MPRKFYARDTLVVARELLGKHLVRNCDGGRLSGRIVEVEAYLGPTDPASHARFGPGSRAAPMFGKAGHAYVYFTYGMHYCVNAVTGPSGSGTAILLRALEPLEGLEQMRRNRLSRRPGGAVIDLHVANGPGKLCQALGIDTALNRADLLGGDLWIEDGEKVAAGRIKASSRVGIRVGREQLRRFYVADSPYVSAHPRY